MQKVLFTAATNARKNTSQRIEVNVATCSAERGFSVQLGYSKAL
jgi:hypothetical protein